MSKIVYRIVHVITHVLHAKLSPRWVRWVGVTERFLRRAQLKLRMSLRCKNVARSFGSLMSTLLRLFRPVALLAYWLKLKSVKVQIVVQTCSHETDIVTMCRDHHLLLAKLTGSNMSQGCS